MTHKLGPGEIKYETVSPDVFAPLLDEFKEKPKVTLLTNKSPLCSSRNLGSRGTVDGDFRAHNPIEICAQFSVHEGPLKSKGEFKNETHAVMKTISVAKPYKTQEYWPRFTEDLVKVTEATLRCPPPISTHFERVLYAVMMYNEESYSGVSGSASDGVNSINLFFEVYKGESLVQHIKMQTGNVEKEIRKLLRQYLQALEYLHASGIVANFTPDDVRVHDGHIKLYLTTWGRITADGRLVDGDYTDGLKEEFRAPEWNKNRKRNIQLNPITDIYFFGVLVVQIYREILIAQGKVVDEEVVVLKDKPKDSSESKERGKRRSLISTILRRNSKKSDVDAMEMGEAGQASNKGKAKAEGESAPEKVEVIEKRPKPWMELDLPIEVKKLLDKCLIEDPASRSTASELLKLNFLANE